MGFLRLLLILPLLGACEQRSDTPTVEESRHLDDAANLLDQAPANLESVDDSGLNAAVDRTGENEL